MNSKTSSQIIIAVLIFLMITSCSEKSNKKLNDSTKEKSEGTFHQTLNMHLSAIIDKDLPALKSTLSPDGKMMLIMQGTEIINSVDGFLNFHETWFQDSLWSMETKTLRTEVGEWVGFAVTESIYREPERNGKPYFNRMITSYVLEKQNDIWYVVNDHASSIEKSTDKK